MSLGWRQLRFCLVVAAVILPSLRAFAAPDDVEAKAVPEQAFNQFFMNDENFEANVFQPSGNAKQARSSIESKLKLQLNEIHRICQLDDAQLRKLKLAAGFDVKRFFDEVDVVRQKFKAGKHDQAAWNQIWQEINPLQMKMATGLFNESSFFCKSIPKTLSEEQYAKYDAVMIERRRFRYQCAIETALTQFEDVIPLTHAQHEAIVKLIFEETSPPLVFGQHDYQVVMYQFSRISEAKLKAILDDRQWSLAEAQRKQYQGANQFLIPTGVLAKENDDGEVKVLKARVRRRVVRANAPADASEPENPEHAQSTP